MAPPMGRPKSDNPKNEFVATRMDAETIAKLEYCMKALNMTRAEVLRQGVERVYQEVASNKK